MLWSWKGLQTSVMIKTLPHVFDTENGKTDLKINVTKYPYCHLVWATNYRHKPISDEGSIFTINHFRALLNLLHWPSSNQKSGLPTEIAIALGLDSSGPELDVATNTTGLTGSCLPLPCLSLESKTGHSLFQCLYNLNQPKSEACLRHININVAIEIYMPNIFGLT